MKVLYVEDDRSDADLVRREISRHDPQSTVEVAPTLAEARRLLADVTRFDLVLMDLRLPDGRGLDLLREIRGQGLPLAAVILTSAGDEETVVAALKAGADDYLAKREGYLARLPTTLEAALGRFRAETARRAGTLRVLYAEHHAADVVLTRLHLETHAAHVRLEIVESGGQVLRLLPPAAGVPCPCDVLLLDYRLPGDTALDVLKVIKEERRLDLPVVLVTGQGDEEVAAQALRLGAADYLVKNTNYLYALPGALENAHQRALLARQQAALRDSEARIEAIISSAMDAVVSIDEEQRVVLFNPAAERMFRCRRDEALGSPLERFIPERFRAAHRGQVEGFGGSGVSSRAKKGFRTVYGLRADGQEFPTEASISSTRVSGRALYTVILRDVSEIRRAEQERSVLEAQLRQSQKMEAIGRLAGGVAHDFNNMLSVILGYAELALKKMDPLDPLHGTLQAIRSAAQRSADLTRQLLAFARQQAIAPQVLDLNARLNGMEHLLQRIIGEDVDLVFVLPPDLWPVCLDPSQVDQVLANLAVNSRDAMPEGGRLTVETKNVTLDEAYCRSHAGARTGDYVMLTISDTGSGMDEPTRERAFEPFFTTKPDGTGLGLATVFGVVKQNDGFIDVDSDVGRGTIVTLYLPRFRGRPVEAGVRTVAAPSHGNETVLLVEDQPDLRVVAGTLLEELGYVVLQAGSPGEALRLCEEHAGDIHLLFTDVVMPGMNGKELASRIKVLRPAIETLFTSGYTADTIGARGVLDPGIHFIDKPFTLDSLARKMREVLSPESGADGGLTSSGTPG